MRKIEKTAYLNRVIKRSSIGFNVVSNNVGFMGFMNLFNLRFVAAALKSTMKVYEI